MVDIGSKVKDKDGNVGVLVGFTQCIHPLVLFANEVKIFTSIDLLEEVKKK